MGTTSIPRVTSGRHVPIPPSGDGPFVCPGFARRLLAGALRVAATASSSARLVALASVLVSLLPASPASAEPCTTEQRNRILSPPTVDPMTNNVDGDAIVDCDLYLDELWSSAISRRLVFRGSASSRVTLDCGGGTIDPYALELYAARGVWNDLDTIVVRSAPLGTDDSVPAHPGDTLRVRLWDPAVGVTIRNCTVIGSLRIYGMQMASGGDTQAMYSSREPGHVARMRAAAPRGTRLEQVDIIGVDRVGTAHRYRTPLYIGSGAQDTMVVDSHIGGTTGNAVAIYLDAESTRTTIQRSIINPANIDPGAPLITIDGSDRNRIANNLLGTLDHGGIYLFRNCGEKGRVRWTTPSHNEIVNNVFYYRTYTGPNPGVWLGSRNGVLGSSDNLCDDDEGEDYGLGANTSNTDNHDFARFNIVAWNQFFVNEPGAMIKTLDARSTPNTVRRNTQVTDVTVDWDRHLGAGHYAALSTL